MIIMKPQRGHRKDEAWPYTMERLPKSENEDGIHTPACLLLLTQLALPEMLHYIAKDVSKYENERRDAEMKKRRQKESTPVENEGGSFFRSLVQFIRDELSWYGSDESEISKSENKCDDFGQTSMTITDNSKCATKEMGDGKDDSDLWETCSECTSLEEESEDQKHSKIRTCDFSHGPIESPIVMVESSFEEAQSENNEHESFCTISRKLRLNNPRHSKDGNESQGFKRARECFKMQSPKIPYENLLTYVKSSKRVNDSRVHFNDDVESISNNSTIYDSEHQFPHSFNFTQTELESSIEKDKRCVGANDFEGYDGEYLALISKVNSKGRQPYVSKNASVEVNNAFETETYYSLEDAFPTSTMKMHSKTKPCFTYADECMYQNIIRRIRKLEKKCNKLGKRNKKQKREMETQERKREAVTMEVQKQEPGEDHSIYLDVQCDNIDYQIPAFARKNSRVRNDGTSCRFAERPISYEYDETSLIIAPKTKRQKFKARISEAFKKMAASFKKMKKKKKLKFLRKLKIKRKRSRTPSEFVYY